MGSISGLPVYVQTENYLSELYPAIPEDEYLFIDATIKDEDGLRAQILSLQKGEALYDEEGLIAGRTSAVSLHLIQLLPEDYFEKITDIEPVPRLRFPGRSFCGMMNNYVKTFCCCLPEVQLNPSLTPIKLSSRKYNHRRRSFS
jgi:hypothetical protein